VPGFPSAKKIAPFPCSFKSTENGNWSRRFSSSRSIRPCKEGSPITVHSPLPHGGCVFPPFSFPEDFPKIGTPSPNPGPYSDESPFRLLRPFSFPLAKHLPAFCEMITFFFRPCRRRSSPFPSFLEIAFPPPSLRAASTERVLPPPLLSLVE